MIFRGEAPVEIPQTLKRKPTFLDIGRRGKPSGRRGDFISSQESLLIRPKPKPFSPSSLLRAGRDLPSRLKPIVSKPSFEPFKTGDVSKIAGTFPIKKPSVLIAGPLIDLPSVFPTIPKEELPSALVPTPSRPSILPPTPSPKKPPVFLPPISKEDVSPGRPIEKIKKLTLLVGIGDVERRRKQGYIAEIKESEKSNKFIPINRIPLPKQRAINLGAATADTFKQRTFRIKRSGTTPLAETPKFPLKDKFRGRIGKSKLPPKVFVEKTKFAIDHFQEKLAIPFRGLAAIRQRIARQTQTRPQRPTKPIPEPFIPNPIMIKRRGGVMRFL